MKEYHLQVFPSVLFKKMEVNTVDCIAKFVHTYIYRWPINHPSVMGVAIHTCQWLKS